MQLKIITDKDDFHCDVDVIQKNKLPSPTPFNPYCEYSKKFNKIVVSVPSCLPNVYNQDNEKDWKNLVNSYVLAINKAIQIKKNSVLIKELGESLLWKDCLIAKAAKEALTICKNNCKDDFVVVFLINEKKYKLWDELMQF